MKYVVLSVGGEVRGDKNRGGWGSADGGRGSERVIAYQRNNLTRFMMHGKLTASGTDLEAEKAASNRGRGRGGIPGHPPKKVGFAKSRLLGELSGIEAARKDYDIMEDM